MNKDEFVEIVKMIKTAFPKEKFLETPEQFELWFRMLNDIPFGICQAAMTTWIMENPRTPAISDIRERCLSVSVEEVPWEKAWDSVIKAVKRYGSYKEAEALESMDEVTREAVRAIDFRHLCFMEIDDLPTVRAQFRDIYKNIAKRKKNDNLLPPNIRQAISEARRIGIDG